MGCVLRCVETATYSASFGTPYRAQVKGSQVGDTVVVPPAHLGCLLGMDDPSSHAIKAVVAVYCVVRAALTGGPAAGRSQPCRVRA
jgi:hypothetical protein